MVASVVGPWGGLILDAAGDKDRAPRSLPLPLRLRGSMWRLGEATSIIAGRYESRIAFDPGGNGCCALVMPVPQPLRVSPVFCRRADVSICFRKSVKLGILRMW